MLSGVFADVEDLLRRLDMGCDYYLKKNSHQLVTGSPAVGP